MAHPSPSGCRTSNLSTAEFAAVRSVGYEPVGQVMGCSVYVIGRPTQNCMSTKGMTTLNRRIALFDDQWIGYTRLVESSLRAALGGADFAVLVQAGYRPVDVVMGVGYAVGHIGAAQRSGTRRTASNQEVPGWTAVAHAARARARDGLGADVAARHGEGCVLASRRLRIGEQDCIGGRDFAAQMLLIGTAVARSPGAVPPVGDAAMTTMLPLSEAGRLDRRNRSPLVQMNSETP